MNKELLSVIVPTYNGAHKIPALLRALERQTLQDFELLIVIDGSTDDTLLVLKDTAKRFRNVRIIEQQNRGRAAVRNTGAKHANGSLLIFFDDDMEPLEQCLDVHAGHHQRYPGSLLSGAQIDDDKKASNSFQEYKANLSVLWCRHLLNRQDSPLSLNEMHLTAANFSIGRDLFFSLGGFDEALRDAEDLDLAIRAQLKGHPVYYNHQAFAWHNDYPTCHSFIKRQKEYNAYHSFLKKTKPEIYLPLQRFQKQATPYLKQVFFSFWGLGYWIKMIDKQRLDFLPRQLKFVIFDWVVTANSVYKK